MLLWLTSAVLAPTSLAPVKPWLVDFAENQCIASRSYGEGKDEIQLAIKPSPTSDVVQIIVVKDGAFAPPVQLDVSLKLGSAEPLKVKQLRYGGHGNILRVINLPAEQAAMLSAAQTITWSTGGSGWILQTGPMDKLMKALEICRSDLRDYWNITPQNAAGLKSPAIPVHPALNYFSSEDYPQQAIRQDEGGTTSVVVLIDEKGKVRDCMIDGTSGVPTLDAMTCVVFRERVKFAPAITNEGEPVRSFMTQRIRWELP